MDKKPKVFKEKHHVLLNGKEHMHLKKKKDPITGEEIKTIEIQVNDDIESVSVSTKKDRNEYIENKKRQEYFLKGRRKKPFVQTTSLYEEEIVGTFSSKKLECLVKLFPCANYNSDKELNSLDVIRIKGKPAIVKDYANLWKVTRKTAAQYLVEYCEDGVLEETEIEDIKGKVYRFKNTHILRGLNQQDDFTKKIVSDFLTEVIEFCESEVKKVLAKEKRRAKPRFDTLYPLALLGACFSVTHYKTFLLLKNHDDPKLVKEGEKVTDALAMAKRRRQFKFVNKKELWAMYSGQNISGNLSKDKSAELESCVEILIKANAMGEWRSGKNNFLLMNPKLIYVSPNIKCDPEWRTVISSLFNLGGTDFTIEEE